VCEIKLLTDSFQFLRDYEQYVISTVKTQLVSAQYAFASNTAIHYGNDLALKPQPPTIKYTSGLKLDTAKRCNFHLCIIFKIQS